MKQIQSTLLLLVALVILSFNACQKDDDDDIDNGNSNNNQTNEDANRKGVGESANDLLTEDEYEKLVVEVQFPSGYSPRQKAIDNLKDFLANRLHKPAGIEIRQEQIGGLGEDTYSIEEIRNIEKDLRTKYNDDNTIAIYLLFVDGRNNQDDNNQTTLGVAYYNTSAVIFEKTIQELSGGLGEPDQYKLETAVINHEMGHLLGLVNNGTPMQQDHQDDGNGHHCDVEDCLMYYAVETGDVVANLVGSSVPELDQQCLDDLSANGGK